MLVIFDCDGVLIDSEIIFCSVDADALTGLGHPTSAADIARRFAGVPHREAWNILAEELDLTLPGDWLDTIKAECDRRFKTDLAAIAGAATALETLRARNIATCVASSTSVSGLRRNLGTAGLLPLVEGRVFSVEQVKRAKPAPDVFLHAASQMGFDPAACLVIEDSVAGVTAARRAGMIVHGFVGASHAFDDLEQRLVAAGAQDICRSMDEVLSLVCTPASIGQQ